MRNGTLELREDSIGLRAHATITDSEVIEKARQGRLTGWSFGFYDLPDGVEPGEENGMPVRNVKDLDLQEVSLLDDTKRPAYDGTLVEVRDDENELHIGEDIDAEFIVREDKDIPSEEAPAPKEIDYSAYEQMIEAMKGEAIP